MTGLIPTRASESPDYPGIHGDIVALLEAARHAAARSVNALMTASYWEIGRRIVEFEQGGTDAAVLPGLAARTDFADTVCEIGGTCYLPDGVWRIALFRNFRDGVSEFRSAEFIGRGLPTALVGLCAPAVRQRLYGTQLL